MLYQNYVLTDGGILSVGAAHGQVRVLLDDRALAGPVDERHALQRMSLQMPDSRGEVAVRLQRDGAFEVLHNRRQVEPVRARSRRRMLSLRHQQPAIAV
ncbi:MAG: hypothetical protein ACR2PK_12415 [Acidimicrobiales bacterium]